MTESEYNIEGIAGAIETCLASAETTCEEDFANTIDALDYKQMHELYGRLRNIRVPVEAWSYQSLRKSLGLWYSAILFGDILCPRDGKDPVGDRMQAVATEALLWCPGAVAAQVVLNMQGSKATRMKVCSVVVPSDDSCMEAKAFHDVTQEYTNNCGTSAQLNIHWRQHQLIRDHQDKAAGVEEIDSVEPQAIKLAVYTGDLHVSDHERKVSRFFQFLAGNNVTLCPRKQPAYIHFASGLDASTASDKDAGGVAHMYVIVCKEKDEAVEVPKGYQGTVHALLSRLVNYAMVVKLDEEQAQLRKYKQMFDLIGEPLKKVTRTLIDAQQEVQQVNAILNPPFHVLADSHQVVKDYFTQGQQAGWGQVRWRISHSPADYGFGGTTAPQEKLRKNHACGCTLAAVVLGIFGRNAPQNASESALFGEFMHVMEGRDDAHEELRELLSIILWKEKEKDKEEFYQQLRTAVLRTSADSNSCLTGALIRLKEIVFRAFKLDETKYPGLALAVALWEWKKDNKFGSGGMLVTDYIKDDTSTEDIFENVIFPFPTYGYLLSFLSSVIAAARSNSVSGNINIKVERTKNCLSLELEDQSQWPLAENPAPLYEMMKRSAESSEPSLRGDLYKPYADIASRCRDGRAHVHNDRWAYVYTDAQGQSRTFSIQLHGSRLIIDFQAS